MRNDQSDAGRKGAPSQTKQYMPYIWPNKGQWLPADVESDS